MADDRTKKTAFLSFTLDKPNVKKIDKLAAEEKRSRAQWLRNLVLDKLQQPQGPNEKDAA